MATGDILSNSGYPSNVQPKKTRYTGDSPSKKQRNVTSRRKAASIKPLPGTK